VFRFIARAPTTLPDTPTFNYQVFENIGITWEDSTYAANNGVVELVVELTATQVTTPNNNPFARFDQTIAVQVSLLNNLTLLGSPALKFILDRGNTNYNTFYAGHVARGAFVLWTGNIRQGEYYNFTPTDFTDIDLKLRDQLATPIASPRLTFRLAGFCGAPSIWKTDVLTAYTTAEEPDGYYYKDTDFEMTYVASDIDGILTDDIDVSTTFLFDATSTPNRLAYLYTDSVVVRTTLGAIVSNAKVRVYSAAATLFQEYDIADNPTGNSQQFPTIHLCDITNTGGGTGSWHSIGVIRGGIDPTTGLPFEEVLIEPPPLLPTLLEERRSYYVLELLPLLCDGLDGGHTRELVDKWFRETCNTRHPKAPFAHGRIAQHKSLVRAYQIGNMANTQVAWDKERFFHYRELLWERLKCHVLALDEPVSYSTLDTEWLISCIDGSGYCNEVEPFKSMLQKDPLLSANIDWVR